MTLIFAKFDADLINISKVTSRKTKCPRFFGRGMGLSAIVSETKRRFRSKFANLSHSGYLTLDGVPLNWNYVTAVASKN